MKIRGKMSACFFAAMLLMGAATMVQAETQLKQLGLNPFYEPELNSVNDLRQMVKKTLPDLKNGFEMAGAANLFEGFVNQTGQPGVEMIDVTSGEKLQWMLYKKGKTVKLVRDVVWTGKKPFKAFRVKVEQSGKRYVFIVPAKCGNVALAGIMLLPAAPVEKPPVAKAPETPAPTPVNKAPFCQVTITPVRSISGEDILIDASQSTDPDGSIASVAIRVLDANNQVVSEQVLNQPPFIYRLAKPKSGDYRVLVSVTDDKGMESSSPGCGEKAISVMSSRGHLVADLGMLYQGDPATYLLFRVGYDYRLYDDFSILGMVGFAPVINGDDDTNSVMADLTGNYHYNRMSFGAGVGYWYSSMNDRLDFIVNIGYRIYGERDQRNASLFIEGRSAFDEFNDLRKYGRIGAGIRFQF